MEAFLEGLGVIVVFLIVYYWEDWVSDWHQLGRREESEATKWKYYEGNDDLREATKKLTDLFK